MAICKECGAEVTIGDWPWCPHGQIRETNAKNFDAIVVWQSNSDPDKYSFPGQANESVPEGYHPVSITNIRQADQFCNRFNALERTRLETERQMRWAIDDAGIKERRANEDARGTVSTRADAMRRAVREWADRKREAKRTGRIDPRFHNNVLSFDSGHRNSYSGEETRWRERKP
jgi:hypothetical protein